MAPQDFSRQVSQPNPPSSGWQAEIPLGPQPGIDRIDQMCANADAQERRRQAQPADIERMVTVMAGMMQIQTQTLQALAVLMLRDDDKPKAKSKRKPKQS
jgi:hypothetical protein